MIFKGSMKASLKFDEGYRFSQRELRLQFFATINSKSLNVPFNTPH